MKIKNSKALFDFNIIEKFEFGIALIGSEVKSVSKGKVSINGSYLSYDSGQVYIYGMHIGQFQSKLDSLANEQRKRAILLHKREKNKIIAISKEPGKSVVPLELYFNANGFVKLLCAICEGKKLYDKRAAIKEREWKLQKQEMLKKKNQMF